MLSSEQMKLFSNLQSTELFPTAGADLHDNIIENLKQSKSQLILVSNSLQSEKIKNIDD